MAAPAVVVGGGVIGLTTAHFLRQRGLDVTLVDRSRIGAGASAGNAGWLVPSLSAPLAAPGMVRHALAEMLRRDGALRVRPNVAVTAAPWLLRFARHCNGRDHQAGLRATASLAARAVDGYAELADAGVEFSMRRSGLLSSYLSPAAARRGAADLSLLRDFGYDDPALLNADAVHAVEPALSDRVEAGFVLGGEAVVDPGSLLIGLERHLRASGVTILEGWPVSALDRVDGRVTGVRGPRGRIPASRVVVAAGAWTDHVLRGLGARAWLQAGKGYSLSARLPIPLQRPVLFAEAKSGASPLGGRVRVVGHLDLNGLDEHAVPRRLRALERVARRYLRDWPAQTAEPWCGLRSVTPDGVPVLSRVPGVDNVVVGAGHGLLGVTLAVASGALLTEMAVGDAPSVPNAAAFSIARFSRSTVRSFEASGVYGANGETEPPVTSYTRSALAVSTKRFSTAPDWAIQPPELNCGG